MTKKEFIEAIQELPDDHELVVKYMGGMGPSCSSIKSVRRGMDWTNNKIVLNVEPTLTVYDWYNKLSKRVTALAKHKCKNFTYLEPPIEQLEKELSLTKGS